MDRGSCLPSDRSEGCAFRCDYETTREKVSFPASLNLVVGVYPQTFVQRKPGTTETIPGLNVGKSVIQQVISTLEDWPVNNHHLYKHAPEAQI
jgi:hypothetical protein